MSTITTPEGTWVGRKDHNWCTVYYSLNRSMPDLSDLELSERLLISIPVHEHTNNNILSLLSIHTLNVGNNENEKF